MASDAEAESIEEIRPQKTIYCCVGVVLIAYLAVAIFLIIAVHINCFTELEKFRLLRAHLMCGGFGMLGASMAAMRKFYRILITEDTSRANGQPIPKMAWSFGWVFYYITRPILGGVLGSLSYTLSFVGFNTLAPSPDIEISNHGRFLLYGLAFVSGFAVSQVLDRLNTIAKQLFQHKTEAERM